MSKRQIKAKRWEKRRFKKEYGLSWMFWYCAEKIWAGKKVSARDLSRLGIERMVVCPRHPGKQTVFKSMGMGWTGYDIGGGEHGKG